MILLTGVAGCEAGDKQVHEEGQVPFGRVVVTSPGLSATLQGSGMTWRGGMRLFATGQSGDELISVDIWYDGTTTVGAPSSPSEMRRDGLSGKGDYTVHAELIRHGTIQPLAVERVSFRRLDQTMSGQLLAGDTTVWFNVPFGALEAPAFACEPDVQSVFPDLCCGRDQRFDCVIGLEAEDFPYYDEKEGRYKLWYEKCVRFPDECWIYGGNPP